LTGSSHARDPDVISIFALQPPLVELTKADHWIQYRAIQWAGEWRIIDTPTSKSVLGVEASYLDALSPMVKDAPVMYELYYQQQWYNRYLLKPQIQYLKPPNSTLSTKESLVFGLSADIYF
jgi:hypothetical protein